jgi:hypothetical protein
LTGPGALRLPGSVFSVHGVEILRDVGGHDPDGIEAFGRDFHADPEFAIIDLSAFKIDYVEDFYMDLAGVEMGVFLQVVEHGLF